MGELFADSHLILGQTLDTWVVLAILLATFVRTAMHKRRANREASMVQILAESLEETAQTYPSAGKLGKQLARHKATKLGLQVDALRPEGVFADTIEKHTKKYKKLGPDDPTPDPEAKEGMQ